MVTAKSSKNIFFTKKTLLSILTFKVFLDLSLIFSADFYVLEGGSVLDAFMAVFVALYYGYIAEIGSLLQGYSNVIINPSFWLGFAYLSFIDFFTQSYNKEYVIIPIMLHLAILYFIKWLIGKFFFKADSSKSSQEDPTGTLDAKTWRICFISAAFYALPIAIYGLFFGWIIDQFASNQNYESNYKLLLSLICYAGGFIVIAAKIFSFANRNINSEQPKSILFKSMFELASRGVAKASQEHLDKAGDKVSASNQRIGDLTSKAGLIRSHSEERRLQNAINDRHEDRGWSDFAMFIVLGVHYLVNLLTYGLFKLIGLHRSLSIGKE